MLETVQRDLTIIGGGLAGVCAAITAARGGLTVALVQNRPVLGGNSSSEVRMWTRGATGGGNLFAEEMGVLGELKLENLYRNPEGNVFLWDELLLDFILRESNVSLFLNTHVTQAVMADRTRIGSVLGWQLGSEREFKFTSSIFLDATGDATIGFLAGADYRRGREGKAEFGEELAPDEPDEHTLGSTILLQTRETKRKVVFVPPAYAYSRDQVRRLLERGGRVVNERMNGCDYWWLEYGGIRDTIADNQEIALELKRIALGLWDYIKNSGNYDADRLTLEWIGSLPGKRESRRLLGDYLLTQNDLVEHRPFEDAVCYGGWFLDLHPPEGIYSEEAPCRQIPVSVYGIPLRCLYSRNIENLLMAGRNISVTHAAFTSTRIMNTCALTGQAAGEIARHMVLTGNSARRLLQEGRVDRIQQDLLAADMFIPGCRNTDPLDLAKTAEIEVSTVRSSENATSCGSVPLDADFTLVFPYVNGATLSLMMDSRGDSTLSVELYDCVRPEGCRRGRLLAEKRLEVRETVGAWVQVPLQPRETGTYHLVIKRQPKVAIHVSPHSCPGVLGLLGGNRPRLNPCFRLEAAPDLYAGGNLTNGYNRHYILPNLWSSDQLDRHGREWIILNWAEEIVAREVRLFFNPDLSEELSNTRGEQFAEDHGYVPRQGMPPELVKSYAIYALVAEKWKLLASCDDNRKRLAVHTFPEVKTRKLMVVFTETYGSPYVEVFEVRVY